jgi:hypothetical protein
LLLHSNPPLTFLPRFCRTQFRHRSSASRKPDFQTAKSSFH